MVKVKLGKVTQVPVNRVWSSEADFSKWLHDNPSALGEALGCDLQSFGQEIPVGRYRADLVAEMDGYYRVAIENQLDGSNHSHLGQSLTYAAGLQAHALIWIAPVFTTEHLRAVERLNIGMGQNLMAFAVRIKVERIGSSPPVPRFEMLASPDDWFAPSGEEIDYRQRRGQGFFRRLCEESGDRHLTSGSNSGFAFMAGVRLTDISDHLSYTLRFRGGNHNKGTSVHLWIESPSREANFALFQELQRNESEIEREFGRDLSWEPNPPGRLACAIRAYGGGSIDDSSVLLTATRADMLERYTRLRTVLDKRLPAAIAKVGFDQANGDSND